MSFWTYANLAEVTQGRWLVEPEDLAAEVNGLWHDTREIKPGQAYLAIAGENFDGHGFVDKAFDAGAALAIVQKQPPSLEGGAGGRVPNQPMLRVNDTVKALQDLARAYRDALKAGGCKIIGIAGSNGKTTTRHLIHHVLTHGGLKGSQSPKSFNNHLGVPLTLLGAKPSDDFVACEIGTNHPGEIDFLSAIARPDIAVITSIGEEHLEFFKDLKGVAKEEASILEHVVTNGIALVQQEAWESIQDAVEHTPARAIEIYGLGERSEGLRISPFISAQQEGQPDAIMVRYQREEIEGVFYLHGDHNLENAGAAVGVGLFMGIDMATLVKSLASATLPDHRGRIYRFGSDITVIDDAYNANPTSMRAALRMLGEVSERTTCTPVAILGDMYELGETSDEMHHAIAHDPDLICNPRLAVLIGNAFSSVEFEPSVIHSDQGSEYYQFTWSDNLPGDVADLLQPGDTVLLKASRGMRLERLIPAIERRFGPAEQE